MANNNTENVEGFPNKSVIMEAEIPGLPNEMLIDQTFTQVMLNESLLSPSLTTQITLQDVTMTSPMKNYDLYKGKNFILSAANPNIPDKQLDVNNVIFRMEDRKPINRDIEVYKLFATDVSLLKNHQVRMTKQYHKQSPTSIANDALAQLGITKKITEESTPTRDYNAKNVHPFEVINDQANYGLVKNDPSLLHYMTYEDGGTHRFESVKSLTEKAPVARFVHEDYGSGEMLGKTQMIMAYEFPCEFDLLGDIMNGVGKDANPVSVIINTVKGNFNALGGAAKQVLGNGVAGSVFSNKGTTDHSSETAFENAQRFRAARLSLLRPDRISLRITVPFNPGLHVGNMITTVFPTNLKDVDFEFGTGDYLIVSLTHNLRVGGYGVTTLDLVSRTVGSGET